MTAELAKLDKAQAKLADWLREQIEMRTRGLQRVEFNTRWSSQADEHVGSVDELTEHLKRSRGGADGGGRGRAAHRTMSEEDPTLDQHLTVRGGTTRDTAVSTVDPQQMTE